MAVNQKLPIPNKTDLVSDPSTIHGSSEASGEQHENIRNCSPSTAGLFVQGSVGRINICFTIDTGASVSLLAKGTYDRMEHQPELRENKHRLKSASGELIESFGIGEFSVTLGQYSFRTTFYVADITDDALIGADLLL